MSPPTPLRIAILTISDSRTRPNDESGQILRRAFEAAGFVLSSQQIVPDERPLIEAAVLALAADPAIDAVVTTGGTGIAPRDCSIEAIAPLLDKVLDGFGEAFRRLSWEEVGPRAVLSRALGGSRGATFIAVLPGSPRAVRLAAEQLLVPLLGHATALLRGETKHGPAC